MAALARTSLLTNLGGHESAPSTWNPVKVSGYTIFAATYKKDLAALKCSPHRFNIYRCSICEQSSGWLRCGGI
jgi:hypothetical protein